MRRLWWGAVLVLWLAAGCADPSRGGGPFRSVAGLPGEWVEVFEGSFRLEDGSWVFVDQWATMAGLEARLLHRVVPWPDRELEWRMSRRYDDGVWVVLEFLDASGEVVATGDDWASVGSGGSYFFEVVMADVPRYSSYRLRVGTETLVEFEPAGSVPDIEVVEVTLPRIERPTVHDAQPAEAETAPRRRSALHAEARPRLEGDIELVVQTPEPGRLLEDFHALVYFSKDGETYTGERAYVSSLAAGPGRVALTLPRLAAPDGLHFNTVVLWEAPRARFLVVFTDGGRWAAAQSPTASLGWPQKPPGLRPLVTDDPVVTSVSSSKYPRRFAAGDTIVLAALTNPGAVHHAVNCNHDGAVVSWSSDIDGSLDSLIDAPEGPCAPYLLDASKLTPGGHQFTASVTDHRGLTATVPAKWVFTIEGDSAAAADRIAIIARDDHITEVSRNVVGGWGLCVDVLANDRAHRARLDTGSVEVTQHPEFGTAAISDGATCEEGWSCIERQLCLEYTLADAGGLRSYGDRVTYQVCDTQPQPQCDTADLHIALPLNWNH